MTPIDSGNDRNICVELFKATLTMKLRIKKNNLKLPDFHCYTRNISEIWRVET